jgi:hypothetical protein
MCGPLIIRILNSFLRHYFTLHIKSISKLIEDLNISLEAVKALGKNIGDIIFFWIVIFFCPRAQKHRKKSKTRQIGLHKTRKLLTMKKTTQ